MPPSFRICSAIAQAIDCLLKTPVIRPRLFAKSGSIASHSLQSRVSHLRDTLLWYN